MRELMNAISMLPGFYTAYVFRHVPGIALCYGLFLIASMHYHVVYEYYGYVQAFQKIDLLSQFLLSTCISGMCSLPKACWMLACLGWACTMNFSDIWNRGFTIGLSATCIIITVGLRWQLLSVMSIAFLFYLLDKTRWGAICCCHMIFHLLGHWVTYKTIEANTLECLATAFAY